MYERHKLTNTYFYTNFQLSLFLYHSTWPSGQMLHLVIRGSPVRILTSFFLHFFTKTWFLKPFYSIFPKKHNSYSHFKCIKSIKLYLELFFKCNHFVITQNISAFNLNSTQINHRLWLKIIEKIRNIYPNSTFHPFFLAFKDRRNIFYLP